MDASRLLTLCLPLSALTAGIVLAGPASARTSIRPYLEVGQVVTGDFAKGGDVLTYSTASAGIDASIAGARSEVQASYRYEHRFGWKRTLEDGGVHSGLLRARLDVVPDVLSLEAGAVATRARSDFRGDAPAQLLGDVRNVSQVYSVYAGPSFQTSVGDLQATAAYRAGYTRAEGRSRPSTQTTGAGQPLVDAFDQSLSHMATASMGMQPGALPVGWQVSVGAALDNGSQLDQRFTEQHGRGDLTLPMTPTVALVGGAGYEKIKTSQRPPKLGSDGLPLVDQKGRFVTDTAAPRQLSYEFEGVYWDAGVLWQPSRRTSLEARAGRRYGSMSYQGSFSWQASQSSGLQAAVYDQVETFGQELTGGLSRLPTSFRSGRNTQSGFSNACTFGGKAGAVGGCLNNTLGSMNTAAYRSRGVSMLWSETQNRVSMGFGAGYNRRNFVNLPQFAEPVVEQAWFAQSTLGYAVSRSTSLSGDMTVSLYDTGLDDVGDILSGSVTGSLTHRFSDKLDANATISVSTSRLNTESDTFGSALASLRYSF